MNRPDPNSPPVRAADVVAYILTRRGPIQQLKLQKLLFYCQAWRVAYGLEPLFLEDIEARAAGPVVPSVWRNHEGEYEIEREPQGDALALAPDQQQSVDSVLERYGDFDGNELSRLTRNEAPWIYARGNGRAISRDAMARFYGEQVATATAAATIGRAAVLA